MHLGYGFLSILFVVGLLVTATIGIALRPKGFMLGVAQLVIGLVLMAFLGL